MAMFLSVFGYVKKTSRNQRKVAPEKQKIYLTKSADSRKSSKTLFEFTQESNTSTDKNEGHDQSSNVSFKDLYNADGFDEQNAVPGAKELQVPFDLLVPDKSTNADTNISENDSSVLRKQFAKMRQELKEHRNVMTRVVRELKEIRNEIKNHRKWY